MLSFAPPFLRRNWDVLCRMPMRAPLFRLAQAVKFGAQFAHLRFRR